MKCINNFKALLTVSAPMLDRLKYPGYRKHYSNTLSPWHRTRKITTDEVQNLERYAGSYLSGLPRGPYLGYSWNRSEGSSDRGTTGSTTVGTKNIDGIKYNTRKQYAQNREINIKLTNTINENQSDLPLQPSQTSNITNEDMVAQFKHYDEIDSKMSGFLQRNESEKDILEKHDMTLYPLPPSVNNYTLTPVKHLKLKTREKTTRTREDSEYDDVDVSVTSTYKNSDDKITDNKNMLTISGLELMAVLSQLRAENRNYSMQILV